ncbi:dual specificity protein phosphatase 14-like [Actinia tenebrosa]|uniref:protein-serine/threonine phosphatase n=1 Tax=Actinia tenebrosa TaxID=6105 RepID=A0A6P8HZK1_ACTTE|nr:dual specificity protein phosphatase 14-like [Actinia tenebrosa]XP_031558037.1 dual specificity protein phosphatase 14-like [Actinia tenebrosa]
MAAFKQSKLKHVGNPLHEIIEITDYLYLGSVIPARNEDLLKEKQITHIVNATVESDHEYKIPVECMKIKITDSLECHIGLYFDIVADKIEKVKNMRGKVLVHCMAGISRSSSLVIAYLMKYKKMSLRDAYHLVKKKRPIINPNPRFWQSLVDYEKKLFGKTTVTMKESEFGVLVPAIHCKSVKDLFNW